MFSFDRFAEHPPVLGRSSEAFMVFASFGHLTKHISVPFLGLGVAV